ncbi:hypothetical protein Salat_1998100 [Sesamum alatum]|uniref:MADS-box domain-containing protein n=1 Tax=Sesamum alatum TaxID=300844 RepID=A0AAE1XZH2_9LAMI|nr:hypothetical protein Salat_1998100 [Sesamum alatum]
MESLIKKANELSILCGVSIGIVLHKPLENNAVLWPSPEVFSDRLRKFLDFSESERAKKMVTHEKYLHHRLNDENEDLSKSHNKKELKESQLLLNELLIRGKDFSRINLVQLNDLQSFAAQMLKKLEFKDDEFNEQERCMPTPPPPPRPYNASFSHDGVQ